MNKYALAAVVTLLIILGIEPAAGQEEAVKITPAAEQDFVQNEISATLAASCKKLNPQRFVRGSRGCYRGRPFSIPSP